MRDVYNIPMNGLLYHGKVDWRPDGAPGKYLSDIEIVFTCQACQTETVVGPNITACAGCNALLPVVMVTDPVAWLN
jgi:hypothetical protein